MKDEPEGGVWRRDTVFSVTSRWKALISDE